MFLDQTIKNIKISCEKQSSSTFILIILFNATYLLIAQLFDYLTLNIY